ncbi:malto-oligosyltrehalose synthase [Streptomyces sp. BI20]|uniref:malto-oligosyltrehalose synthase n=1 Tax=Streptomyces sp. BI20 TaxID=3403460 RepID=UPI003C75115B
MTQQYSSDHRPTATYRLQLHPGFPFGAATAALPYLASLGVSHLHLSPVLEAAPGSTHGYDVVDHSRVRAELGGERALRELAARARELGLGLVLDIVPNHMAVPRPIRLNRPLWEVLREGPESPYARWFDVDWEAHDGRFLLAVAPGPVDPADAVVDREAGVLRAAGVELPLRAGTAHLPPARALAAQHWRLAWWREGRTALNYRRFFTISDLIGVRVEDPEVFDATHAKILELVADGVVDGLRIDHVDGLADPEGYLRRLRAAVGPRPWVVVEKILAATGEELPASWPVAGTTGYDALHRLDGVLLDPAGPAALDRAFRAETGLPDWPESARRAAHEVLHGDLAAELDLLTRRAGPDAAPAVAELLLAYPVYRSYPADPEPPTEAVTAAARALGPGGERALAGALELLRADPGFAARFAQTSAALRAKSLEDRAFYRYAPLLSACEVGGEPGAAAVSPDEFHAYCARLWETFPHSGTVVSTHDTKRSADVRARLAVLAEVPDTAAGPEGPPAPGDPHLAWVARQTRYALPHTEPDRTERLGAALLKAVREAGLRTTWTEPDEEYEAGIAAHLPGGENARAEGELGPPDWAEAANVLALTALHLTMPGVPEVYQGGEGLSRTLVDPDNRRPVAFPGTGPDTGTGPAEGSDAGLDSRKRELTAALLRLRRAEPGLFGAYAPVRASGPAAEHVLGFTRGGEVLTLVTRLPVGLAERGGPDGTTLDLPPGRWAPVAPAPDPAEPATRSGRVPVAELLTRDRPVLVLRRVSG